MAESLGEKLRLAREGRGITLSEVAAQTRIAARYLEAIEADNYKPLPGGVFNKGFIKAYAKYVGVDEQEALGDYARIVASQTPEEEENRYRRPSVMTDDRKSSASSIIFAVIILVLMTGGILALVQWYRSAPAAPQTKATPPANSANTSGNTAANNSTQTTVTDQLKIEIKSTVAANAVAPFVTTAVDSEKPLDKGVPPNEPRVLNPQSMVKISYSKSQSANLQLLLNGKVITLPTEPLKPTDGAIVKFEINKNNAAQIISAGQITPESQAIPATAPNANANVNSNIETPAAPGAQVTPGTSATPRPATPKATPAKTPAAANTASVNAATVKTPPKPIFTPTVITPKRPGE
jgi:cytoskeletal protein RodZ